MQTSLNAHALFHPEGLGALEFDGEFDAAEVGSVLLPVGCGCDGAEAKIVAFKVKEEERREGGDDGDDDDAGGGEGGDDGDDDEGGNVDEAEDGALQEGGDDAGAEENADEEETGVEETETVLRTRRGIGCYGEEQRRREDRQFQAFKLLLVKGDFTPATDARLRIEVRKKT